MARSEKRWEYCAFKQALNRYNSGLAIKLQE
jgi:hypothetical protein